MLTRPSKSTEMNYKELSLDKFMIIAALKSPETTDLRSVIHPETLSKLIELEGSSMMFESGIGKGINVSDEALINSWSDMQLLEMNVLARAM